MSSLTRHCKFFVSMYATFHVALMHVTSGIVTLFEETYVERKVIKLNIVKSSVFHITIFSSYAVRFFDQNSNMHFVFGLIGCIDFHEVIIQRQVVNVRQGLICTLSSSIHFSCTRELCIKLVFTIDADQEKNRQK